MNNGIQTVAMLVSINISSWSGRKLDREVTAAVNANAGATPDAGRYNKMLVPEASLAEIVSIASSARTLVNKLTLPWDDSGRRILPVKMYDSFLQQVGQKQREFAQAVETFLDEYPSLREQRRFQLNSMFNENEYPSVQDLARKFAMDIAFDVIPNTDDVRVALPEHAYKSLCADVEARINHRQNTAMRDLWQRLSACITLIAERCGQEKGRIHDTLFTNLQDLLAVVDAMNITNDPGITEVSRMARERLAVFTADDVRGKGNADQRQKVADMAEDIARQMAAFC